MARSVGGRTLTEISTMPTPVTGTVEIYAKPDGRVYHKNDVDEEIQVASTKGWSDHVNGALQGGGFKAWTFDPIALNGGIVLPTNGVVYLTGLWTPVDILVSNIHYSVQAAGATLTSASNHVALYGANRARLATVDQTTAFGSTGLKTAAVTPVTVPAGRFWVAFLANGTTRPSINRSVGQGLTVLNGLHAGTASRFASSGTSQTAMPAGPITLAAITTTTLWAAVS